MDKDRKNILSKLLNVWTICIDFPSSSAFALIQHKLELTKTTLEINGNISRYFCTKFMFLPKYMKDVNCSRSDVLYKII